MSTPPDQMQGPLGPKPPMPAAGPGGGPPPAPGGGGPEPAPAAASAMTPQQPKGEQASAAAQVMVSLRFLEQALVAFGSTSPEGKELLKAITGLTRVFSRKEDNAKDVLPAELKSALLAPGGQPQSAPEGPPPGKPAGGAE